MPAMQSTRQTEESADKLSPSQINLLRFLRIATNQTPRNEVECALLDLVGIDYEYGYFNSDVVRAVTQLKPAFGERFDHLLIAE